MKYFKSFFGSVSAPARCRANIKHKPDETGRRELWINTSVRFVDMCMIPLLETRTMGFHRELPLKICRMIGNVLCAEPRRTISRRSKSRSTSSDLLRNSMEKRHLHAHQSVSFMYNPEAKGRGHVLRCYNSRAKSSEQDLGFVIREWHARGRLQCQHGNRCPREGFQ